MRNWNFIVFLCLAFVLRVESFKFHRIDQHVERISGSAGDVLEDDPTGR